MARIVAFTLMGIDGAVDDPQLLFPPSDRPDDPFLYDAETEAFEEASLATQDALLLGRRQWEEWQRYWPRATGPFADFVNAATKHVLTSRPLAGEWAGSAPIAGPLEDAVAALRAGPGRDVGVHGSIRLVQSLLAAELLDELRLVVSPVAGTPGRRLFESFPGPRRLRLVDAASSSAGNLLLTYA